ncbi:MAG: pilus assembly protein PilX [Alcaligenaceae bacterium]|nr:MAG: pilus assembly protein PilX [Alcaligenaceae bacterium]
MTSPTSQNVRRGGKAFRQRGISLFIVMIMVLLTTLFALWGARSSLLNEKVTGNDSDYQRAFEAAQAMVRDAELDIMGTKADGSPCVGTHCRPLALPANIDIANNKVYFPQSNSLKDPSGSDLDLLKAAMTTLPTAGPQCLAAICLDLSTTPEFWSNETQLKAMKKVGARYGEFTGANAADIGNPLLKSTPTAAKAWYWVEPLLYQSGLDSVSQDYAPIGGGAVSPGKPNGFIFRITAVAEGLKDRTSPVVVQAIFIPQSN